MRKVLIFVTYFALAFACNKVTPSVSEYGNGEVKKITVTVSDFKLDGSIQTKTAIQSDGGFKWAANDTLGIYPSGGAQVYFVVNPGADARYAAFDGGGWNFKHSYTYYGYYPFIGNIYLDKRNIPVVYTGQKQTGQESMDHIGGHDFMWSPGVSAEAGTLNFSFHHLNCIIRNTLTLPAGTYTKLAITAPGNLFVKKGHYDLTAATPAIVGDEYTNQIQIDLEGVTLAAETTFKVYLMSAPVDLNGKNITVSVLNSSKMEMQCAKTPSKAYQAEMMYGLTCNSWTEVPQSMGLIIDDWGDGGSIGGDAE